MGEIICTEVTKIWGAETTREVLALDAVSPTVQDGEFLVVIGPSGCGKSTLLMMLADLEMATAGTITYNGAPITGAGADRFLIFQQPSLYPWLSALDNVAFGLKLQGGRRKEYRQRAEQFLRQVGLRGFAHKHPHELSGGMQQRAAIARALCLGADVLLMDEPFAALDVQTRFQMQSFLLDIWQGSGKTVVFVTHHIDEAVYLADRVIILRAQDGSLTASRSTCPVPATSSVKISNGIAPCSSNGCDPKSPRPSRSRNWRKCSIPASSKRGGSTACHHP